MISGTTDTTITQYVYDEQGRLLGEYDFFGNPKQETVYLGDLPIAALTQTTTLTGPGAVMVDNTDTANVTVVGAWPSETTVAGFQGTDYQTHIASAGTDSFTWTLNLPTPGKYYIQARWTADSVRGYDVKYTVTGTDGVSSKLINQRTTGNTWTNLWVKTVAAPGIVTVKLNTNSTGKIAADAVQALPVAIATSVNYVFADHLGTPRVITRATDNQMLWRWDNADPFGVTQPNTNPAALGAFTYNPRFPGQLYDAETGLYYNYHRSYSPGTGTYTQSDPIGLGGGINTYAYVGGNPVNAVDPLGLSPGTDGAPSRGIGGIVEDIYDALCPPDKPCPPCKTISGKIVPVGTVAYRPLDVIPDDVMEHGVYGSHHNIFIANQNPNNCQCFWQKQKYVLKTHELPPDAIPIELFAN